MKKEVDIRQHRYGLQRILIYMKVNTKFEIDPFMEGNVVLTKFGRFQYTINSLSGNIKQSLKYRVRMIDPNILFFLLT